MSKYKTKHGMRTHPKAAKSDQINFDFAVFIFGNVGYAAYAMTDINRGINNNNVILKNAGEREQEKINNGVMLDTGVGVWLPNFLGVGLVSSALTAQSTGGTHWLGQELMLPAQEWGGFLKFRTRKEGVFFFTGTLELNYLSLVGATADTYRSRINQPDGHYKLFGATLSTKLAGGLECVINKHFGLGLDLGYRWAKITDVRGNIMNGESNVQIVNDDGSPLSIDYSGFFAQGGIRFYF